jgi:hypothetical protein
MAERQVDRAIEASLEILAREQRRAAEEEGARRAAIWFADSVPPAPGAPYPSYSRGPHYTRPPPEAVAASEPAPAVYDADLELALAASLETAAEEAMGT